MFGITKIPKSRFVRLNSNKKVKNLCERSLFGWWGKDEDKPSSAHVNIHPSPFISKAPYPPGSVESKTLPKYDVDCKEGF